MEELKRSFRPEFLNRIDEVIVFHSLSLEDVKSIVDLMMKRVREQLKAKDVDIELTDAAKSLLAEKGYDPALGARPLRRTIQRLVEDPLSEKLLWKEFRAGQTIIVDARDGEIVVALVGEEATVKRFFREKDQVRLQPENKSMKPIRTRDVRLLGRVVGVFRSVS